MAYAVSLGCLFGALALLHRPTAIELGERYARPALMLLAFFSTAFFFGIPYSEAPFLLLAVGAFLAARLGRWAVAGIVLALASATRVPGLLLVLPGRTALPIRAARRPRAGSRTPWLVASLPRPSQRRMAVARSTRPRRVQRLPALRPHLNVAEVGFVALAIAGGIGALRILPVAYGSWVPASLVPIFVSQPPDDPLWSSPRFIAVLFPIFLWLAVICERRRATTTVVALSAVGMAVLTAEFTLWSFVS